MVGSPLRPRLRLIYTTDVCARVNRPIIRFRITRALYYGHLPKRLGFTVSAADVRRIINSRQFLLGRVMSYEVVIVSTARAQDAFKIISMKTNRNKKIKRALYDIRVYGLNHSGTSNSDNIRSARDFHPKFIGHFPSRFPSKPFRRVLAYIFFLVFRPLTPHRPTCLHPDFYG